MLPGRRGQVAGDRPVEDGGHRSSFVGWLIHPEP
jgi:hypothetical protein